MVIKNKIHKLIVGDEVEDALSVLNKLISDGRKHTQLNLFKYQFNKFNIDARDGLLTYENKQVNFNNLIKRLLQFVDDIFTQLGSDIRILKDQLLLLINGNELITDALSLLHKIVNEHKSETINNFQIRYDALYLPEDIDQERSNRIKEWQKSKKELLKNISEFCTELEEYYLLKNWKKVFFDYLLTKINEISSENHLHQNHSDYSSFFNDIKEIKGVSRKIFLLWQEEYLTKNHELAKKYIDDIRTEYDIEQPLVYEYSLITYLHFPPIDLTINQYLTGDDESVLNKLLLFIERIQYFKSNSETKKVSLANAYNTILTSLRKFYQNISYDYVSSREMREKIKKRRLVKKCIDTALRVYEQFEDEFRKNHLLFHDLFIELLGGGKYLWITIGKNGSINRHSSIQIENGTEKLEEILKKHGGYNENELANNLLNSLEKKAIELQDERFDQKTKRKLLAKKKLIVACDNGYNLFKKEVFNELKIKIGDEDYKIESSNNDDQNEDDTINLDKAYRDAISGIPQLENRSRELENNMYSSAKKSPRIDPKNFELKVLQKSVWQKLEYAILIMLLVLFNTISWICLCLPWFFFTSILLLFTLSTIMLIKENNKKNVKD